jgi:hypothetical protein
MLVIAADIGRFVHRSDSRWSTKAHSGNQTAVAGDDGLSIISVSQKTN